MLTPRHFHYAAAVLPSGEVLVVGGSTSTQTFGATETAEIYSETTGTFRAAPPLDYPVAAASAAPLPRGDVLLVGGCIGGDGYCSSDDVTARIYDVAAGSWRNTASLFWGRETAAALPLASGKILVVGGTMYSDGSVCTEVFDPATETWSWSDPLRHDHGNGAAAVLLPGGDLLVSGGALMLAMPLDTTRVDQATIRVAERFRP
jgi:hypothetical protein